MDNGKEAGEEAMWLGLGLYLGSLLQGTYSVVEYVRHSILEGHMTEHALSHLAHAWPLIVLVAFPEITKWVWAKVSRRRPAG